MAGLSKVSWVERGLGQWWDMYQVEQLAVRQETSPYQPRKEPASTGLSISRLIPRLYITRLGAMAPELPSVLPGHCDER